MCALQDVHIQLQGLARGMRVLALVAPFARAVSSESLTALYARTFERAAFGFAKVRKSFLLWYWLPVLVVWAESNTITDACTAVWCMQMYLFCLFMRVLLSWFPGIDWNAQPWTFLRLVGLIMCCWQSVRTSLPLHPPS